MKARHLRASALLLLLASMLGSSNSLALCAYWPSTPNGLETHHKQQLSRSSSSGPAGQLSRAEMLRYQQGVQRYIADAEQRLERCSLTSLEHNYLISRMQKLAERYNEALALYLQQRRQHQQQLALPAQEKAQKSAQEQKQDPDKSTAHDIAAR